MAGYPEETRKFLIAAAAIEMSARERISEYPSVHVGGKILSDSSARRVAAIFLADIWGGAPIGVVRHTSNSRTHRTSALGGRRWRPR